jgi:hypothetical protein
MFLMPKATPIPLTNIKPQPHFGRALSAAYLSRGLQRAQLARTGLISISWLQKYERLTAYDGTPSKLINLIKAIDLLRPDKPLTPAELAVIGRPLEELGMNVASMFRDAQPSDQTYEPQDKSLKRLHALVQEAVDAVGEETVTGVLAALARKIPLEKPSAPQRTIRTIGPPVAKDGYVEQIITDHTLTDSDALTHKQLPRKSS